MPTSSTPISTSSLALYRKYRPQDFGEVVGQEAVVKALEGAISQKKISHAYIFSGSRGTGKTSVARIFARALKVSANDIYEIDAASNRGIDDIRELRDGVNVMPFESPYKVYIVDEVHMLTKEAWNALLKTLEEPPSHVIFILATTELEKIPDTIISRCQTFSFKKPSRDTLKDVVVRVSKKEGYSLEAGAAELVALLGDGSFRDTLGTLQKVISAVGGVGGASSAGGASSKSERKITVAETEAITGAPRGTIVNDFIAGIATANAEQALGALTTAGEAGVSMKTFATLVLEKYRIALLIRNAPLAAQRFQDHVSEEDWKALEKLAKTSTFTPASLIELLKAYDMIGRTYIDSLPLELAVMQIVGQNKAQAGA